MKKCMILTGLLLGSLLGQTLFLTVHAEGETDPLWARPRYEKKVVQIGQRLLARNHINQMISFTISHNADTINAASSGDYNTVTVYSGLLRLVDSDDELASILAHEIGHILNHDTLKRKAVSRTLGNTLAFLGGAMLSTNPYDGGYYAKKIKEMTDRQMANLGNGRELAADSRGMDLMVGAGYSPLAMESMLQKIESDGYVLKMFRDHPSGTQRLKNIHQQIASRYPQFLNVPSAPETVTTLPPINAQPATNTPASITANVDKPRALYVYPVDDGGDSQWASSP